MVVERVCGRLWTCVDIGLDAMVLIKHVHYVRDENLENNFH